ncbi:MAG: hypothetical protein JNL05_15120 [Flavobacteriales bacterium]|nr:hypothetical protein [Flavobacteriales bacterium]
MTHLRPLLVTCAWLLGVMPVLIRCGSPAANEGPPTLSATQRAQAGQAAVGFVNDHVNGLATRTDQRAMDAWIAAHPLLTEDFKRAYHDLVAKARAEDPELGLDHDPVLNAQDHPNGGFAVAAVEAGGLVTLRGVEWPDFRVQLHMVERDGRWLVDGCGAVNKAAPHVHR